MVDARKPLHVLRGEWEKCVKCKLGERRQLESNRRFVFGEGSRRGVMFIGEGPGVVEEETGRPFVGPSGRVLRDIIQHLGMANYYITNLVACRSCTPVTDETGSPKLRWGKWLWKDEPPLPSYIEACRPRLYEEIYLVDPVVIVALGAGAAEALLRKKVAITNQRGEPMTVRIPGASYQPSLTEKKKSWVRAVKGQLLLPVVPTEVEYICIPTFHPAFVARKIKDHSLNSPFRQLVKDIHLAARTYERYTQEIYGAEPAMSIDVTEEFITQMSQSDAYEDEEDGEAQDHQG